MTEDDVLSRVGRLAREEQSDDARFERVARGEADAAELEELERKAAADPVLATRLAGSRPLDAGAVDRITERVLAARSSRPEQAGREGGNIISLRARWLKGIVAGVGPLALAAAMILYVVGGPRLGPSSAELPEYSVTATSEQAMRGAAEASARLRVGKAKDARFEIVLRPATASEKKIVAYAFAIGEPGSDPNPLDAKTEVSEEGAVRITGSSRALEGAREIRVVVGAPESIGKFDDAVRRATSGGEGPVRVLVVPIDRE
jgi:hypothetical protein